MTHHVRFEIVRVAALRPHEETEEAHVGRLVEEIRARGRVDEPIWIDRASGVILNGHHRWAALRRLGVPRAPAWVVDYRDGFVRLTRWGAGPVIAKEEVLARARDGPLFPPKTTRHELVPMPPSRPTALSELGNARRRAARPPPRASRPQSTRGWSSPGRKRPARSK